MTLKSQDAELIRLEILHAYKRQFARHERFNLSPFEVGQIVRYGDDVRTQDVPEIHQKVRQRIEEILAEVRQGGGSRIVMLTGDPGMGKTHLINFFRPPEQALEGEYVLVGNSNHWQCSEFEACLLDWMLEALLRPSPEGPNLLLDKIEDVAFQALAQLLSKPGAIDRYLTGGRAGPLGRLWRRLAGNNHARFQKLLDRRDVRAFRLLDFRKFASYVCDRFLHESGHPFHRYVLQVLLRYLYPEDRELVVHWLRRRPVGDHFLRALGAPDAIDKDYKTIVAFLRALGAADAIDQSYKVIDTIKVLITLFSNEVADGLSGGAAKSSPPLVFFFAFDQPEGRDALFDSEADWRRFFAQLSELYNTLPNVLILFTMTQFLGKRLHPQMEGQFRDRIQRDHKLMLHAIEDSEVLALYTRHIENWLGPEYEEIRPRLVELGNLYLPFNQQTVIELAAKQDKRQTLRDLLKTFDERFRHVIVNLPTEDPVRDYRVFQNEIRREEPSSGASPFPYTASHIRVLHDLFTQFGKAITQDTDLAFHKSVISDQSANPWHLELYFLAKDNAAFWVRVFVCRLTMQWRRPAERFIDHLAHRQRNRNLLFLLRNRKFDAEPLGRGRQIFAREYPVSVHTDFQAMLRLLANQKLYESNHWPMGEHLLLTELKRTYVGDILKEVQNAIARQRGLEEIEDNTTPEPALIDGATVCVLPEMDLPLQEVEDD